MTRRQFNGASWRRRGLWSRRVRARRASLTEIDRTGAAHRCASYRGASRGRTPFNAADGGLLPILRGDTRLLSLDAGRIVALVAAARLVPRLFQLNQLVIDLSARDGAVRLLSVGCNRCRDNGGDSEQFGESIYGVAPLSETGVVCAAAIPSVGRRAKQGKLGNGQRAFPFVKRSRWALRPSSAASEGEREVE
jgi:hypothetical protein